ncbi:DUF6984 family protein [Leptospira neocaledonica]|uniref:DUF6984 domain-containing protein n=1 Tax=Leptospira neocaledonica TaxID=2023192 RepID=A0A2M9ZUK1_9LEPT|nr:hypothetical protein [Leptospira neocaledonica]PJZ75674.1 hypothetical protein CH365_18215 [Leptospira neocaledonica]
MKSFRQINSAEERLLVFLLKKSNLSKYVDLDASKLKVQEMDDGGMGSLFFLANNEGRRMNKSIASLSFYDIDGIEVSVTLNIDQYGDLYELDLWKVDFSKLKKIPEFFE